MEKPEDKKQNNRKEDEKRPRESDSENNTTPSEKEWDPKSEGNKKAQSDDDKIKALKGIRSNKDSENA
ncbi:hypothetical protein [Gelidibacter salicanalis]|uniref:Uncharacterized protein n=1 Tax=Gelidibacter salicanalis TaxID=291193 RepID=A0A934KQ50_9FLAO|nr:hypothetical protein [Gelidibacter salicanalis]MBJ7881424.1 hypothetical protein [Gelidibacter salicanalis]